MQLSASETLLAAELQAKYGPHFVTLKFTKDRDDALREFFETTAWQVHDQCVELAKEGLLARSPNPFKLASTR